MPRTAALDSAINYKFAKNKPTKLEKKTPKLSSSGRQKIQRYSTPLLQVNQMKKILASALSLMLTACATTATANVDVNPVSRLAMYQVCTYMHAVNNDLTMLTSNAINQEIHLNRTSLSREQRVEAGSLSLSVIKTFGELDDDEFNRLELLCYKLARQLLILNSFALIYYY